MVYTTLRKLREAKVRYIYLKKALGRNYGDNNPIDLCKVLEINGLDALLIPESALEGDSIQCRYRLFAVACCQDILHLMDQRSRDMVRIAHLYAYGEATYEKLTFAWTIGKNAARVASRDSNWVITWAAAMAAACDFINIAAWNCARFTAIAITWDFDNFTKAATRIVIKEKFAEYFKIIFSTDFNVTKKGEK